MPPRRSKRLQQKCQFPSVLPLCLSSQKLETSLKIGLKFRQTGGEAYVFHAQSREVICVEAPISSQSSSEKQQKTSEDYPPSCHACLLELDAAETLLAEDSCSSDEPPVCRDFLGVLKKCRHIFHGDCILKWAETENSCPQCKERFASVGVYDLTKSAVNSVNEGGLALLLNREAVVEERDQDFGEEAPARREDYYEEGILCRYCSTQRDPELLLLCSQCDAPYHTYCCGLGREIPEGLNGWWCPNCTRKEKENAQLVQAVSGASSSSKAQQTPQPTDAFSGTKRTAITLESSSEEEAVLGSKKIKKEFDPKSNLKWDSKDESESLADRNRRYVDDNMNQYASKRKKKEEPNVAAAPETATLSVNPDETATSSVNHELRLSDLDWVKSSRPGVYDVDLSDQALSDASAVLLASLLEKLRLGSKAILRFSHLQLARNHLGAEEDAGALSLTAVTKPSKVLDLSCNFLSDKPAAEVAREAVRGIVADTFELDLSSNRLSLRGAGAVLRELLRAGEKQRFWVRLGGNRLGGRRGGGRFLSALEERLGGSDNICLALDEHRCGNAEHNCGARFHFPGIMEQEEEEVASKEVFAEDSGVKKVHQELTQKDIDNFINSKMVAGGMRPTRGVAEVVPKKPALGFFGSGKSSGDNSRFETMLRNLPREFLYIPVGVCVDFPEEQFENDVFFGARPSDSKMLLRRKRRRRREREKRHVLHSRAPTGAMRIEDLIEEARLSDEEFKNAAEWSDESEDSQQLNPLHERDHSILLANEAAATPQRQPAKAAGSLAHEDSLRRRARELREADNRHSGFGLGGIRTTQAGANFCSEEEGFTFRSATGVLPRASPGTSKWGVGATSLGSFVPEKRSPNVQNLSLSSSSGIQRSPSSVPQNVQELLLKKFDRAGHVDMLRAIRERFRVEIQRAQEAGIIQGVGMRASISLDEFFFSNEASSACRDEPYKGRLLALLGFLRAVEEGRERTDLKKWSLKEIASRRRNLP